MSDTKKPEKESPRCMVGALMVADFEVRQFSHKAEAGVTRKHLLEKEYWSHVSEVLTPYSKIEVRNADGSYYGIYLVLDCSRGWAKVQELNWWNLTTADVADTQSNQGASSDYEIAHKGPNKKWVVIRKSDGVVISKDPIERKEMAQAWLTNWLASKSHSSADPQTA